ncbi:MAG: LysR family transcriptional regulator, partial [Verrucomicrobiota bacterium]
VEEGGFSAAARRINRSQSAISLQIAKLEERLDAKLLERSSRSVSLTTSGESFLSYARRIIELSDEAMLAVTAPDEKTLLRVGFAEYLAPQHLPDLLARFRRAHPNCDLSLMLGMGIDLIPSLEEGKLDLVFAGPEAENGELLWEEELVWTASKEFSKEDHEEAVELVLMHPPCSYRQIAFDALTRIGKPWKLSIDANSVQAVLSAIRANLGISVLPRSAVPDGFSIVSDEFPAIQNTSVMSYVRTDKPHPYSQRFVEYLIANVPIGKG